MSITAKIINDIRNKVREYETNRSQAENQENLVNGFKNATQTKSVKYQLREAQSYQTIFETNAANHKQEANRLYMEYKEYIDSNELSEVEEMIDKL
ncbi:hypothetical protein [Paenibacillus typhae]|uniref:Uncharacterized protein n=1 Tax=Paenibacillus typhae TaxID=1174501 RepID=A0A1G9HUG8_9BACL|nr:hypothetical protein [Paenibacillus typhae]SDL16599.1 hypothetical protein SAMN05216192_1853 [Paenibacillus typhae]